MSRWRQYPLTDDRWRQIWAQIDESGGPDACWLWTGKTDGHGYGCAYTWKAHRAAWTHANGTIPKGMCVCHRCDNPPCCNPAHLFLGTMGDNMRDKTEKGRARGPRGEASVRGRLTRSQVQEIRGLLANGENDCAIAKRFGVWHTSVRKIRLGLSWSWL